MFGSMLVTSAFIGFADTLAQGMWVRRWGMRPKMQFWPFNLGVAGGAVAISRLVALQPGLLFGAPGGLDYGDAELDEQRERTLLKIGLVALGARGVVAGMAGWLANQSSLALAARGFEETPALLVGLRNVLLLLFYGALAAVFFQMMPFANTYGLKVLRINKLAWAVLFIPIAWLLARLMFNPESSLLAAFLQQPVQALLLFMGGLTAFTTFVYLYFRKRDSSRPQEVASGPELM
jgi:hypothetical protein